MEKTINLLKRYKFLVIMLIINITLLFVDKNIGSKAFTITAKSTIEMLEVIPPIFILLGTGTYAIAIVLIGALLGTYIYGLLKDKLPH